MKVAFDHGKERESDHRALSVRHAAEESDKNVLQRKLDGARNFVTCVRTRMATIASGLETIVTGMAEEKEEALERVTRVVVAT